MQETQPPVTSLSNYQLSKHQITLLTKGLNFIPTSRKDHPAKILQDILLFDRKIRLKYHFYNNPDQSNSDTPLTVTQLDHHIIPYCTQVQVGPLLSGQAPFLGTYTSSMINEFCKELDHPPQNQEHYKTLDKDPTIKYSYMHHLIDQ